jgi:hypothetical protein
MAVPALEIQQVDLIERIVGFAFALEDERLPVRCEVAFAAAFALESQLANVRKETGLGGPVAAICTGWNMP